TRGRALGQDTQAGEQGRDAEQDQRDRERLAAGVERVDLAVADGREGHDRHVERVEAAPAEDGHVAHGPVDQGRAEDEERHLEPGHGLDGEAPAHAGILACQRRRPPAAVGRPAVDYDPRSPATAERHVSERLIRLGHSPDPDDAFMFYALADGLIPAPGYRFQHPPRDIETLNRWAMRGELEVTALSVHAYAVVAERYRLLPHGASMGDRYGPIVVAREPMEPGELPGRRVAIPGELTSAYLELQLAV